MGKVGLEFFLYLVCENIFFRGVVVRRTVEGYWGVVSCDDCTRIFILR